MLAARVFQSWVPFGRIFPGAGWALVVAACDLGPLPRDQPRPPPETKARAAPAAAASSEPPSLVPPPLPHEPAPPGATACPQAMVEVSGAFCPNAEQDCLEHLPDYLKDRRRSERCQRYRDPSRCLSTERPHLHFCIDRFEWPNQEGALPRVLTSWTQARALCEGVGKRLCSESEWLFACEGEQSLPYTYGFIRDPTRCVFDRLTPGGPRRALKTWARCKQDATCWAEFKRLDQREPAGSFPDCISPFGVFDMNGNVNEWVWADSATRYPERSGLKGGWWGPVRDRCRPTVLFHKEDDWGYEVGFRCCQDAL